MANFYLSPYMSLSVPVPTVDPGPDWAQNINASLTIIDGHTHAPGSGVQITPAAININSDLPFGNTNNATNLRSVRFNPQVSAIPASGADLGCLYESGVDLYYNDGGGNQIRITQSGSVAGASGTITGLPSGTASAAFASGTGTFIFQQSTSTGANFDVASIAIRYPGSYPTPSGNYIQLQAPSSLASGYSLTLPAQPSANNTFMTMSTAGVMATTITVDNATIAISSNQLIVKTGGITRVQQAAVGQQVSSSSGSFSQSVGSSFVSVTNLSVTLTTSGRPVMIIMQPDGVGAASPAGVFVSQVSGTARLRLTNGSTGDRVWQLISSASAGPLESPGTFAFLDTPTAGTYTYTAAVNCSSTVQIQVLNMVLAAYEL